MLRRKKLHLGPTVFSISSYIRYVELAGELRRGFRFGRFTKDHRSGIRLGSGDERFETRGLASERQSSKDRDRRDTVFRGPARRPASRDLDERRQHGERRYVDPVCHRPFSSGCDSV